MLRKHHHRMLTRPPHRVGILKHGSGPSMHGKPRQTEPESPHRRRTRVILGASLRPFGPLRPYLAVPPPGVFDVPLRVTADMPRRDLLSAKHDTESNIGDTLLEL